MSDAGQTGQTGLSRDSGTDTAVERWIRMHHDDVVRLGFPIDGYLAERDTTRRLQLRLGEARRIDEHRAARIAELDAELAAMHDEAGHATARIRELEAEPEASE